MQRHSLSHTHQRVQVAEKEAKLQQFNRKLSSIKAGVRKELEKVCVWLWCAAIE